MSFIHNFKEFRELKNGKVFNTNDLYVGKLGRILVTSTAEDENYDYYNARFYLDKYVIVTKATDKEANKHLDKKYKGLAYAEALNYEKLNRTTYYKLITMDKRVVPSSNAQILLDSTPYMGEYEVISSDIKPLNTYKGHHLRFADTLTLEDVKGLEEIINQDVPTAFSR